MPERPEPPTAAPVMPGPRFRALVSAFIVFHLACITVWSLPSQSKLNDAAKRAIRPWMLWSGLWQGWEMFSPNPLALNVSVDAEITFRDGTTRRWVFPRPETMGYGERYVKERYRKLRENVRLDFFRSSWPHVARYLARLHADPENPPVEVVLTRHWTEISVPTAGAVGPRPRTVPMTHSYAFFSYRVEPTDLVAARPAARAARAASGA